MTTKQRLGLHAAHEWILKSKTKKELVQNTIDTEIEHAKKQRTRNRAGAIGRAKKYASIRANADKAYADLKSTLGKNPPLKAFRRELKTRYPNEKWPLQKRKDGKLSADLGWDRDVVEEWWKALNRG